MSTFKNLIYCFFNPNRNSISAIKKIRLFLQLFRHKSKLSFQSTLRHSNWHKSPNQNQSITTQSNHLREPGVGDVTNLWCHGKSRKEFFYSSKLRSPLGFQLSYLCRTASSFSSTLIPHFDRIVHIKKEYLHLLFLFVIFFCISWKKKRKKFLHFDMWLKKSWDSST